MAYKKHLLTILIAFLAISTVNAQKPISVSISVAPPYSPFLSGFTGLEANKVFVTVQNLTGNTYQVKLLGSFKGDNGVSIQTKPGYMPQHPLVLGPHQVRQFNGTGLSEVFDVNNLSVTGISMATLQQTLRLPEGNYNVCVQALDFANNTPLSDGAPGGCTMINILYPDAPVLVNPMPGDSINNLIPQNIVFTWMNPGSTPIGIEYTLQVAEMPLPNGNPNQVLNAATFPLLNQKLKATSYIYNISNLPLKPGTKYAWRVIADDATGKTLFKNNGISNAGTFVYQNKVKPVINVPAANNNPNLPPLVKTPVPPVNNTNPPGVYNPPAINPGGNAPGINPVGPNLDIPLQSAVEVSGILKFRYHPMQVGRSSGPVVAQAFTGAGSEALPLANQAIQLFYGLCLVKLDIKTVTTQQKVSNKFIGDNKITLDKNTNIIPGKDSSILVITRIDSVAHYGTPLKPDWYKQGVNDAYITQNGPQALAATTTDSAGSFKFAAFPNGQKTSHIYKVNPDGTALVFCYYINIVNQHYTDPTQYIYYNPNIHDGTASVNIGSSIVYVYNHELTVNIDGSKMAVADNDALGKATVEKGGDNALNVYVLRPGQLGGNPAIKDVPVSEGDNVGRYWLQSSNATINKQHWSVIAKRLAVPKKDGSYYNATAQFKNLIYNLTQQEQYYIYAEYKGKTVYFQPIAHLYLPFDMQYQDDYAPVYEAPVIDVYDNVTLAPSFVSLTVKGVLKYSFKDGTPKPLPNVSISLVNVSYHVGLNGRMYDFDNTYNSNVTLATTTSGINGFFQFDPGIMDYSKYDNNKDQSWGSTQYILINNAYYANPGTPYQLAAGSSYDIGEVVARVKEYSLTVHVTSSDIKNKPASFEGQRVFLCRSGNANLQAYGIPADEGMPSTVPKPQILDKDQNPYNVVAYGLTDVNGNVTFKDLVVPDYSGNQNDNYYVYSESAIFSLLNYSTEYASPYLLPGTYPGVWGYNKKFLTATDIDNWAPHLVNATVNSKPQTPFIEGSVYPSSNSSTSALSGVKVDLYDIDPAGRPVASFESNTAAYGVNASLGMTSSKTLIQSEVTGADGVFYFDYNLLTPSRWKLLVYSKNGFITGYNVVNAGTPITNGFKQNIKGFMLPPADVIVTIKDAKTNADVACNIVVSSNGDNFSWGSQALPAKSWPAVVHLATPYNTVTFTVIPEDNVRYHTQTFTRYVPPPKTDKDYSNIVNYGLPSFTMTPYDNLKNVTLNLALVDAATKKTIAGQVSITGIPADGNPAPISSPRLILSGYNKPLSFSVKGSFYTLQVTAPGYVAKKIPVYTLGSYTSDMTIELQPGLTVKGNVTTDGKPLQNAKVYIQNLSPLIEGYTDAKGDFTLSGLPNNSKQLVVITATKAGDNIIGQSKDIYLAPDVINVGNNQGQGNIQINGNALVGLAGLVKVVNFSLTSSPAFDLTLLYGFPLDIESLTKKFDGYYYLTGKVQVNGNATFTVADDNSSKNYIHFTNIKLKSPPVPSSPFQRADKIPLQALAGFVETDEDAVSINAFSKYTATLHIGNKPVTIEPLNGGADGVVKGAVTLDIGNFASNIDWEDHTWLQPVTNGEGRVQNMKDVPITAFVSSFKVAPGRIVNAYTLNTIGNSLPFTLNNIYNANADEDSYVSADGAHLNTTIHTNLENVTTPDIAFKMGTLVVNDKNLVPLKGATPIAIPLDSWKITSSDWSIENGPLKLNGNIAAGAITVPVTGLEISANTIAFGQYNLDNISIAGVQKLSIDQNNAMISFGYDKGAQYGTLFSPAYGCWSLSMLPKSGGVLTTLMGLPDIAQGQGIGIMNIALYSKGGESRITLTQNQQPVTLNGFAKFTPYSLENGDGFLKIRGQLNMNIPGVSGTENVAYNLNYKAQGGVLVHQVQTISGLKLVTNGIRADFGIAGQSFAGNALVLNGTLMDKVANSPYALPIHFSATANKFGGVDTIGVNVSDPAASMAMAAGKKMANIKGRMKFANNAWGNFSFEGDVTGATGMAASTHMGFEVKGDLVVSKQAIGVSNMDMGDYGTFSLVYDFEKSAIVGSLVINNVETPAAVFDAAVEVQIGSDWYMLASAVIKELKAFPFPLNGASAAFYVGDADITPQMMQIIQPVFHNGEFPIGFENKYKHLTGALVVAGIDVKLPLPDVDIDVDIAHVSIKYGIYANAFASANFNEDKPAIDGGLKVGAYVNVDAGASVGIACLGISAGAEVNGQGTISLKNLPTLKQLVTIHSLQDILKLSQVDIQLLFAITGILKGELYKGIGVCNSNCESVKVWGIKIPPGCYKSSIDGSLQVQGGITMGKDANNVLTSTIFADVLSKHFEKQLFSVQVPLLPKQ